MLDRLGHFGHTLGPYQCKGCGQIYTLGKDAAVATSQSLKDDFLVVQTLSTGSARPVDNRTNPDLFASLEAVLEPVDQARQIALIYQIESSLLSSDRSRWWMCQKCGNKQTYQSSSTRRREFEAETVEEARTAAKAAVPQERLFEVEVIQSAKEERVEGRGKTTIAAIEAAKARVPSGAICISSGEIIEDARSGTVEVQAYSEEEAQEVWNTSVPTGASLEELKCDLAPIRGFLGIGRKQGSWKVLWSIPFTAALSYKRPAKVILRYFDK